MSLSLAWAAWGSDLLGVSGLAASALAAAVGPRPPWSAHLATAWSLACLGAWVWTLGQPSALALGTALALLAGRLAAWSWGLEALALPMAFLALLSGILAHLDGWWPPPGPEASLPWLALALALGWALVLGGWVLGVAARWARWHQGPRGLAQSSGDRDLGALARWAMAGPVLGGGLWLGLWAWRWWGGAPWAWSLGHALLGGACALAGAWAWREGTVEGARLQVQPLGGAKGLGALSLAVAAASWWAHFPPSP